MSNTAPSKSAEYVCPTCKRPLRSSGNALLCDKCSRWYPMADGIPDFLGRNQLTPTARHIARVMDIVAPIYESGLFVAALVGLSGMREGAHFVDRVAQFHLTTLGGIRGCLLDVACGPATYTRRMASPARTVYGIDISRGVLRQGQWYLKRDKVSGVYLARAVVEELPFADESFDGVVCSGSLHLFPDTALALREMARTMKPGAPLSVQTFVEGKTVVNRTLQNQSWVHTFELARLERDLTQAGFVEFRPELVGIALTFSARKAIGHA